MYPVRVKAFVRGHIVVDVLIELVHTPRRVLLHVLVGGVLLLNELHTLHHPSCC